MGMRQLFLFKSLFTSSASLGSLLLSDISDIKEIRNFCIIAHIDHGKSSLADRLLQLTHSSNAKKYSERFLDSLQVEKQRGITVKAVAASMLWQGKACNGKFTLLNLIDTPGHVDFSYEVRRSLAACQGAILLVDATKGVQAQTSANYHLALSLGLSVLPVMNKIDLPSANIAKTATEIQVLMRNGSSALKQEPDSFLNNIIQISAKDGYGIEEDLIPAIIGKFPPADISCISQPLVALVFDSSYDNFQGVVLYIAIKSGTLEAGIEVVMMQSEVAGPFIVTEVGILLPERVPVTKLTAGHIGYFVASIKNSNCNFVGDTLTARKDIEESVVRPLPGFIKMQPMVFAGMFPPSQADYQNVETAINKLLLNDSSVSIAKENSASLGSGFRLGFLGKLHMEVFKERLECEFRTTVITTSPTVPYKVIYKDSSSKLITNPEEYPDKHEISSVKEFLEPFLKKAVLRVPQCNLGDVIELCSEQVRGTQLGVEYGAINSSSEDDLVTLYYELPLSEVVTDFHDKLKSITKGYGTFDWGDEEGADPIQYKRADLVKISLKLNGKEVDALSVLAVKHKAAFIGRRLTSKLKKIIHRQMFEIIIQATIGDGNSNIISRETISALRKDVTAKCVCKYMQEKQIIFNALQYGGDPTRRMKLLERQKEGKKRMKSIGDVELSHEAFMALATTNGNDEK